jgi:hypothetical protein
MYKLTTKEFEIYFHSLDDIAEFLVKYDYDLEIAQRRVEILSREGVSISEISVDGADRKMSKEQLLNSMTANARMVVFTNSSRT